ncbi:hypothetical protein TWF696_004441 [Orbilia brochopaga]|uniref:Uncharacterized protein n=1 Tax=Orbilia brochopaga TaxID=3140254 RepID=A0AAV9V644_9PEZI
MMFKYRTMAKAWFLTPSPLPVVKKEDSDLDDMTRSSSLEASMSAKYTALWPLKGSLKRSLSLRSPQIWMGF